jgi:hypothetical protein
MYDIKYCSTLSLNSAVEGLGGQRHAPAALSPRKIRGTHSTGGRVGPRASLDRCGEEEVFWPHGGLNPRTVSTPSDSLYLVHCPDPTYVVQI